MSKPIMKRETLETLLERGTNQIMRCHAGRVPLHVAS